MKCKPRRCEGPAYIWPTLGAHRSSWRDDDIIAVHTRPDYACTAFSATDGRSRRVLLRTNPPTARSDQSRWMIVRAALCCAETARRDWGDHMHPDGESRQSMAFHLHHSVVPSPPPAQFGARSTRGRSTGLPFFSHHKCTPVLAAALQCARRTCIRKICGISGEGGGMQATN
jgi:hypothetical protein